MKPVFYKYYLLLASSVTVSLRLESNPVTFEISVGTTIFVERPFASTLSASKPSRVTY